jgi:hypothetical protein
MLNQYNYGIHTCLDRNIGQVWFIYATIRPTSYFWLDPPLVTTCSQPTKPSELKVSRMNLNSHSTDQTELIHALGLQAK